LDDRRWRGDHDRGRLVDDHRGRLAAAARAAYLGVHALHRRPMSEGVMLSAEFSYVRIERVVVEVDWAPVLASQVVLHRHAQRDEDAVDIGGRGSVGRRTERD
jgi:hypothetical protein